MYLPWAASYEPFQDYTDRMAYDTPRSDYQRPEVQRIVSLEGSEGFEVYQSGHVYGNSQHCDQN